MTTRSSCSTTLFTRPPGAEPFADIPLRRALRRDRVCARHVSSTSVARLRGDDVPPVWIRTRCPAGSPVSAQRAPRGRIPPGGGAAADRGNGRSGGSVAPGVHRWGNGLKTAVLLGAMGALILLAGQLIGGRQGLVDRARGRRSASTASPASGPTPSRCAPCGPSRSPRRRHRALYAIVRELATEAAPAGAAALRQPDRPAERLRHRPQPAQRRGLLHPGHPRAARPARAARRPRPRALARLQPRHPDQLGGRRHGHA